MLYFAYGSNMSSLRLRDRLKSATRVTLARLPGHRLAFHKVGDDGSGKCDAWSTGNPADQVCGVVFDIAAVEKAILDRIEGLGVGYEEESVGLLTTGHGVLQAFTYRALRVDPALRPYHWYKEHVLVGAREHRLPDAYVQQIELVSAIDDPDEVRSTRENWIYRR